MYKVGIICEYNPFHNGHLYHLNKIKDLYKDSLIILVMSGYFTERGDISLISKYNKVKLALNYGVDVVLELPILYGVNSADYFALYALKILNKAKIDTLIFGSEINNIDKLTSLAKKQLNDKLFDIKVNKLMHEGLNYPTALAKVSEVNLDSNDLLALSYIKAIIKNNYDITPVSIKRTNKFNDTMSNDKIISALNIREKLKENKDISNYIPSYEPNYINKIDNTKLFELLRYKIMTSNDLNCYLGVDEGLGFKLKKEIFKVTSLDDLIFRVKSKRYTYVRLKRMIAHILLGIKKEDMNIPLENTRILGFSHKGQEYLKSSHLPNLGYRNEGRTYEIERRGMEIYYLLTGDNSCKLDIYNKPIIKEKEQL